MKKRTYLVRVTLFQKPDIDFQEFTRKLLSSGIPIHHAEIFAEFDFVNSVYEESVWNEIDLENLFFKILHISETEYEKYLNMKHLHPHLYPIKSIEVKA